MMNIYMYACICENIKWNVAVRLNNTQTLIFLKFNIFDELRIRF